MTAKGWHYEPAIKSEELFYGPGDGPTNPTALVAYRQRYGYGYLNPSPQPVDTTRAVVDRRGAYLASLDPIRRKAYLADLGADSSSGGTGATSSLSGCLGDAETSVRRTRPVTPDSIVDDLASKQAGALQDPAYLAASSRWVACMDGKGFHFRRPADAQASISDLFAAPPGQTAASRGPDSQALEIRTATADAQCSLDTVWPVQAKLYDNLIDQSIEKYGREAVCGEAC